MDILRNLKPVSIPLFLSLLLPACTGKTPLQEICEQEPNTIYLADNSQGKRIEYCLPSRHLATVLAAPEGGLDKTVSKMKIANFGLPNDDPSSRAAYAIGSSLAVGDLSRAVLPILNKELTASPFADGVLRAISQTKSYELGSDEVKAVLLYPGQIKEFQGSRNEEADLKSIQFFKALVERTPKDQQQKLFTVAAEFPDSFLMMALLSSQDTRKEALSQLVSRVEQLEGADDPLAQTILATALNLKDQNGKYLLDAKSPKVNELLEYAVTNAFYPESLEGCDLQVCMNARVQAAFAVIINRPDMEKLKEKLSPDLKDKVDATLNLLRQKADFVPSPPEGAGVGEKFEASLSGGRPVLLS